MRRPERVGLGGALRRAWVGYQRLLDQEMAAGGFGERAFPDGRVLRMCARSSDVTITHVGRELGITRQGASKIVGVLKDRRLVSVRASSADAREKHVVLTAHGRKYLESQRTAARTIERRLADEIGRDAVEALYALLDALGADDQPRLRDYVRAKIAGPYLE